MSKFLDKVNERLEELSNVYKDEEHRNRLIRCSIKGHEFILEKSEIVEIINEIFHKEKIDYELMEKLIIRIKRTATGSREHHEAEMLLDSLKEYKLNIEYNIEKYENNKLFIQTREDINAIFLQNRNFKSFYMNQNKYDNMISILKIIMRLKDRGIKIELNETNFDCESDDKSYDYCEEILLKGLNRYNIIRFIV